MSGLGEEGFGRQNLPSPFPLPAPASRGKEEPRAVFTRMRADHFKRSTLHAPRLVGGVMVLVIDNYDSFTYNLVQYLGELQVEMQVHRNDQITLDQIAR